MPRYVRNTLILAKIETTYGTDATPTGATDAVLVSDVTITPLEAQNVDRNNIRGFFGASEQLVATNYCKVGFTVELVGSGTAARSSREAALWRSTRVPTFRSLTPAVRNVVAITR